MGRMLLLAAGNFYGNSKSAEKGIASRRAKEGKAIRIKMSEQIQYEGPVISKHQKNCFVAILPESGDKSA